jgi:hypothetical protein
VRQQTNVPVPGLKTADQAAFTGTAGFNNNDATPEIMWSTFGGENGQGNYM